jgi:hypothetical protein
LVDEEVVEAEPAHLSVGTGHTQLPPHEQPPPRHVGVHLAAGQQVRVLGEKFLQKILGLVRLVAHLDKLFTGHQVDAVVGQGSPPSFSPAAR